MSSGGVWRPARRAEARTIQFAGDGVAMREEWQEAARARREEQREAAAQALAAPGNASSCQHEDWPLPCGGGGFLTDWMEDEF